MAALVLNVSDVEGVSDQTVMSLGLNVSDNVDITDTSIEVIPSYLDKIYIGATEHFISVLGVE